MSTPAPYPFTLRQLQYALALEAALSFRKAAERCFVSQPSLSAQIAELERGLGVQLFERDRRRVLVTTAGRELLRRAGEILLHADGLADAAQRGSDPLAGVLRIGVIPTISPYLLPRIARGLRTECPRLSVLWIEDKTAVLVHALEAGTLDAALLALETKTGDLEREAIARDPFVLATPGGHPLGAGTGAVAPHELRGAEVLLLDDGHCFRDQTLAFCAGAKASELEFRATSLSTLAQMVAGGAGVTLLPQIAVATETGRSDVRTRAFTAPAPYRTIGLVWRRGTPIVPALQRVAATIRSAFPAELRCPDPGPGQPGPRPLSSPAAPEVPWIPNSPQRKSSRSRRA